MIEILLPVALVGGAGLVGWFWLQRRQMAKRLEAEIKARAIIQAAREAERIRAVQASIPRPDRDDLDKMLGEGRF